MGALYREGWAAALRAPEPAAARDLLVAALAEMRQLTEAAEAAAFGPSANLLPARDDYAALHRRVEGIHARIAALEQDLRSARPIPAEPPEDASAPAKTAGAKDGKRKKKNRRGPAS